ncbi:Putative intracellular protease/amidase [Thiothrix eikelboomii]|uniref:Putative intracellular protease/amidase n=1 Tax=Thiothrix eikelboomii TaxID=92487 RepID=A0A1T4VZI6_9GAMM|nr:type 1 glutamine amidotransferase domain-containing protein [Thiothrix eikelboomii]SKA70396.1 Putative intracellular protease/amidase [Thiothrix eikelboomii]
MSANHNLSGKSYRILMIAANPAVSTVTQWPVGFWLAELIHPYWIFKEAGYEVTIASPDGGKLEMDGFSDPRHASGYAADDILSLGFIHSPQHAALLDNTPSLDSISPDDYDAVFLVGGQSPMFTFIDNTALQHWIAQFYESGKVVAAVCHATCVLLKTRLSDGSLLVNGKTWTGFANAEERFADEWVGMRIQPFWIENEARKLPNTNFIVNTRFREFALRDGRLITGQQQFSGAATARLLIEVLGQ